MLRSLPRRLIVGRRRLSGGPEPAHAVPGIVDFALAPEDARAALQQWLGGWAPPALAKAVDAAAPAHVFLPFWVFDTTVHTKVGRARWRLAQRLAGAETV